MGNIYSGCVSVALVIQHVKGMLCIILPYVAWLAAPHFPTLSHKQHDFLGGWVLNLKRVP